MAKTLEARVAALELLVRELQGVSPKPRLRVYLTFRQMAPRLGFHGKAGAGAARKWCLKRSIPKRWRGNAWLVAEEDLQKALDGHSFVSRAPRAAAAPHGVTSRQVD